MEIAGEEGGGLRVQAVVVTWMILGVVLLLLVGCSNKPLVYDVRIQPEVISPNADGVADVARITYSLSRYAYVSIYFLDEQGGKHDFRTDVPRPKGSYEALFSGVIENRLLPDGHYQCVLEAVADDGEQVTVQAPLTIEGG
ncbi:MAG: hypothetical protein ACPLRM_07630, partial [Anaerolineae bacterium]